MSCPVLLSTFAAASSSSISCRAVQQRFGLFWFAQGHPEDSSQPLPGVTDWPAGSYARQCVIAAATAAGSDTHANCCARRVLLYRRECHCAVVDGWALWLHLARCAWQQQAAACAALAEVPEVPLIEPPGSCQLGVTHCHGFLITVTVLWTNCSDCRWALLLASLQPLGTAQGYLPNTQCLAPPPLPNTPFPAPAPFSTTQMYRVGALPVWCHSRLHAPFIRVVAIC